MKLEVSVRRVYSESIERVFGVATSCASFPRTMRALGPIAGIAHAELAQGHSSDSRGRRLITMTDGVVLDEEILIDERPYRSKYRWEGGLRPPFAWLVRAGGGDWRFSAEPEGTRIHWSYVFELRGGWIALPIAALIMHTLFRSWMARGLRAIDAELARRGDHLIRHESAPARSATMPVAARR